MEIMLSVFIAHLSGGEHMNKPSRNYGDARHYNSWLKRVICVLVLLLPVLLLTQARVPTALAAQDPISAQIEISPSTVTGPYSVRVSITINNVGDDAMPGAVILSDPDGNRLNSFTLGFQKSQSWTGNWSVTQAQLDAGKVTFKLSYPMYNDAGVLTNQTKNLTASIKYNKVVTPSLQLKREITPTNPKVDDTIRIDYTIKNSGNGAAIGIEIEDTGVGLKKGELTIDRLEPGAETVKSFEFKATKAAVTSAARLHYKVDGTNEAKSTNKASDMKITPIQVNLTAKLTANKDVVNKGNSVNLTCEIVNKGNVAYKNIKITDPTLGEVASGISVKAGKSYKALKSVKIEASGTFKFTVTGEDSNGTIIEIASNEVTINTIEDAVPVDLSVTVTSDRDYIYKEPNVAIFTIGVKNNGAEPVKDIQISEADKNLFVIETLKAGEEFVTTREFTLNMGGQFMFKAKAKNSMGIEATFDSNTIQVTYNEPKPTPSPTPTISPTPSPSPTPLDATEVPNTANTDSEGGGNIIQYVFIGLLAIVIMGVGAVLILERKRAPAAANTRSAGSAEVYDHLDRSSRRDYTRVQKSGGKQRAEVRATSANAAQTYQPQTAEGTLARSTGSPINPTNYPAKSADLAGTPGIWRGVSTDSRDFQPRDGGEYAPPTSDYSAPRSVAADKYQSFKGEPWVRSTDAVDPEIPSFSAKAPDLGAPAKVAAAATAVRFTKQDRQEKKDSSIYDEVPEKNAAPAPSKVYDKKIIEPETGELGNLDGQYVLTKRAGSLHPKNEPAVEAKESEDPASFAKKQRARRSREINLAQFYDENE
jgi:hypothetical protein